MMLRLVLISSLFLWLSFSVASYAESITIMTFNVENLFDNTDEDGKNDETYLPLTYKTSSQHIEKCKKITVKIWRDQCFFWDWNDTVVDRKLAVVGAVIKQVDEGRGPDIISLQEIENIDILKRLRDEHLAGLGYKAPLLLEGNDIRGIDVAFLSKYPIRDANLHRIQFSQRNGDRVGDTRPILEAIFELSDGELLTGFAVHFPAPFHPVSMRESAYATLNKLLSKVPKGQAVFAAGDFNTTRAENNQLKIMDRWVRPYWDVSHDLCVECEGTSYYAPKDDWSFLDTVLWRGNKSWSVSASFLANSLSDQVTSKGTPRRFRLPEATGVSDHWPLVMVIESQ